MLFGRCCFGAKSFVPESYGLEARLALKYEYMRAGMAKARTESGRLKTDLDEQASIPCRYNQSLDN